MSPPVVHIPGLQTENLLNDPTQLLSYPSPKDAIALKKRDPDIRGSQ